MYLTLESMALIFALDSLSCHGYYSRSCVPASSLSLSTSILLFQEGRVLKLCDFGTARKLQHTLTNAVGTSWYMAPEVIRGQECVYCKTTCTCTVHVVVILHVHVYMLLEEEDEGTGSMLNELILCGHVNAYTYTCTCTCMYINA